MKSALWLPLFDELADPRLGTATSPPIPPSW